MKRYFLIDEDVVRSERFFPKGRCHHAVPGATDAENVTRAWHREWIIVTANGDDYIREIRLRQQLQQRTVCHDLRGLLILPNLKATQDSVVKRAIKSMRFGGKQINWNDVWEKNLIVRITADGQANVRRFAQCFYCAQMEG